MAEKREVQVMDEIDAYEVFKSWTDLDYTEGLKRWRELTIELYGR